MIWMSHSHSMGSIIYFIPYSTYLYKVLIEIIYSLKVSYLYLQSHFYY